MHRAFSLIELMVVIAIVAILSAVAIPVYKDFVIRTEISKVTMLMDRVIDMQIEYYEKNGYFPDAAALGRGSGYVLDSTLTSDVYPFIGYSTAGNNGPGDCRGIVSYGISGADLGATFTNTWNWGGTSNMMVYTNWVIYEDGVFQRFCGIRAGATASDFTYVPSHCTLSAQPSTASCP